MLFSIYTAVVDGLSRRLPSDDDELEDDVDVEEPFDCDDDAVVLFVDVVPFFGGMALTSLMGGEPLCLSGSAHSRLNCSAYSTDSLVGSPYDLMES